MTWQEVLDSNVKTVTVESYGYTERNIVNSHYEPFGERRKFVFDVLKGENWSMLSHDWLRLTELEEKLYFEKRDGVIYLNSPELWAYA